MKVRYMGKLLSEEEIEEHMPEVLEPTLEYHFAPVRLTPRAIDRASQNVPDEVWKPIGIHSWLQGRADEAWSKADSMKPNKEKEIRYRGQGKRIEFVFERDEDTPVLKTVIVHA